MKQMKRRLALLMAAVMIITMSQPTQVFATDGTEGEVIAAEAAEQNVPDEAATTTETAPADAAEGNTDAAHAEATTPADEAAEGGTDAAAGDTSADAAPADTNTTETTADTAAEETPAEAATEATDAATGATAAEETAEDAAAEDATAATDAEDAATEEAEAEDAEAEDAAEEETAEEAEEAAADIVFWEETEEVTVTATVAPGVFPEGTTMRVAPVSKEAFIAAANENTGANEEVVDAIAVDITFHGPDGAEVQPDGTVSVSLNAMRELEGDYLDVVTVDNEGNAESVQNAEAETGNGESSAAFETDHFTRYGITGLTLQPIEEKSFNVDLSGYTPLDLTMVKASVFTGTDKVNVGAGGSLIWTRRGDNSGYTVSKISDTMNLRNRPSPLEMVDGSKDQLDPDQTRYIVSVSYSYSYKDWLIPVMYKQKKDGTRKKLTVKSSSENTNSLSIYGDGAEVGWDETVYVGFSLNSVNFPNPVFKTIKFFEGSYEDAAAAQKAKEIKNVWGNDITKKNAGIAIEAGGEKQITMVGYAADGKVCGCLPFRVSTGFSWSESRLSSFRLYDKNENYVSRDFNNFEPETTAEDGTVTVVYPLYKGDKANAKYGLEVNYYPAFSTSPDNDKITAAFVGNYKTIKAAKAAGAREITENIKNPSTNGYFTADFSKGVTISVFAGADGTKGQDVLRYTFKTKAGDREEVTYSYNPLSSSVGVTFTGFVDKAGNQIKAFQIDERYDSYGGFNFITILVGSDADVKNVAPVFKCDYRVELHVPGGSAPIKSGQKLMDFSGEYPVQFVSSSEDGKYTRNFWVKVVKYDSSRKIWINSFGDENAKTKYDKGYPESKREVFFGGSYGDHHDIVVINAGGVDFEKVKVTLDSKQLDLDNYFTFSGKHTLGKADGLEYPDNIYYGELQNLAVIRLKKKAGVADGTTISGTLTISDDTGKLAVLTLTGITSIPRININSVPNAVKFVVYSTMITNDSKYPDFEPKYSIVSGALPPGLELKENGEIYGVPTKEGSYTFTVKMDNNKGWESSERQFTLTVIDNSDDNVDGATDGGYQLLDRIPREITVYRSSTSSYQTYSIGTAGVMRSNGEFGEHVKVFLDGVELQEGTGYGTYAKESGSTRITLLAQTLADGRDEGRHTLSIEFRQSDDTMKRANQNYYIKIVTDGGGGEAGGGGGETGGAGGGDVAGASRSDGIGDAILQSFTGTADAVPANTASIAKRPQGLLAQAVFRVATPLGYTGLFTFNLTANGRTDYAQKTGRMVLRLDPELAAAGGNFGVIGLRQGGAPVIYYDQDNDPNTVTVDIDINGYAFLLFRSGGYMPLPEGEAFALFDTSENAYAIARATQGPLAQDVFRSAMPAGYVEAYSFNLLTDGEIDYEQKTGRLVLRLEQEMAATGGRYGLIGLKQGGEPVIYYDTDDVAATLSADIDINGYAFLLIQPMVQNAGN